MEKKTKKLFLIGAGFISAFVLWTLLLLCVDVKPIGPRESCVGFATLNGYIHRLTGANFSLYIITDWLGILPIAIAFGFAILGLFEWISQKSILKVDKSILALGAFYAVVFAAYLFFECVVINYRPVLIEGCLEASYPSSTTMLVMCVMPTAMMQFSSRVRSSAIKRILNLSITAFILFMVTGRLISGVHWFTDIIGGALFSIGIVTIYYAVFSDLERKSQQ